jgi:putative acetyltransferase
MPEFGADGPGFAIHDPEVDDMFGAYQGARSSYWVVVEGAGSGQERVVGGGGFAALEGAPANDRICELRKMYFLPELRGLGLGQEILDRCLAGAGKAGYRRMYLETLESMGRARVLYERNGFERLPKALGHTGHHGCNSFYVRALALAGERLISS